MLKWLCRTFDELTNTELYDLLALRQEVFVLEQQCLFPDLDYQDQKALHLLGYQHDKLVAYSRMFPPGIMYPDASSIGRVVTSQTTRGQKLGREVFGAAVHYLEKNYPGSPIWIGAQQYLKKFYESFGFIMVEEPYDEDGIMHIKMVKNDGHEKP